MPGIEEVNIAREFFQLFLGVHAEYQGHIAAALKTIAFDLRGQIINIPGQLFSTSIRMAQFGERQTALQDILLKGWGVIGGDVFGGLEAASEIAVDSMHKYLELLTRFMGNGEAVVSFEQAAIQAVLNVQSKLINAIDLSPRIYNNIALSTGQVNKTVIDGILSGKSSKELAADVINYVLPDAPGGLSFSAMRLARTEINNAFHTTQSQAMAQSPFIDSAVWNLSKSHPRPDECDDYADDDANGLGPGVFPSTDIPDKPHPQCFCYITANVMDRNQFLDGLLSGHFDAYMNNVPG